MSGVKVLVVESEPWMGEQFERSLRKNGFDVTVTSNAYSAMDIIDDIHPAVVVMGLLLAGVSGLSLLHELQSYTDTAKIPVIVCSGSAADTPIEELRPYGVARVIDIGAMRPDDLPATIRSVLA